MRSNSLSPFVSSSYLSLFLCVCFASAPPHRWKLQSHDRDRICADTIGDDHISGWVAREFSWPPMLSPIRNGFFRDRMFLEIIYWVEREERVY